MVATKHTQSLTDFRQNATETLERLNRTGEAEVLTVNGEARAVMLSPAAFDQLARQLEESRFYDSMRLAMAEHAASKGRPAAEVFSDMRAELVRLLEKKEKRR